MSKTTTITITDLPRPVETRPARFQTVTINGQATELPIGQPVAVDDAVLSALANSSIDFVVEEGGGPKGVAGPPPRPLGGGAAKAEKPARAKRRGSKRAAGAKAEANRGVTLPASATPGRDFRSAEEKK